MLFISANVIFTRIHNKLSCLKWPLVHITPSAPSIAVIKYHPHCNGVQSLHFNTSHVTQNSFVPPPPGAIWHRYAKQTTIKLSLIQPPIPPPSLLRGFTNMLRRCHHSGKIPSGKKSEGAVQGGRMGQMKNFKTAERYELGILIPLSSSMTRKWPRFSVENDRVPSLSAYSWPPMVGAVDGADTKHLVSSLHYKYRCWWGGMGRKLPDNKLQSVGPVRLCT